MAQRFLSMQGRLELWADHAHAILQETAQVPDLAVTDSDLVRLVQVRSDEHTDIPPRSWLPKVLAIVATRAQDAGEPPLTSLVVRPDGKMSSAFDAVVEAVGLEGDRDEAAAEGRLQCYRRFAHGLPEDAAPNLHPMTSLIPPTRASGRSRSAGNGAGGTRKSSTKTAKAAKVAVQEKEPAICQRCFLQLPMSGVCPNCA